MRRIVEKPGLLEDGSDVVDAGLTAQERRQLLGQPH
jgi:hypothetical protein